MERALDKAATKQARKRQEEGIRRLDDVFRVPDFLRRWKGWPTATSMGNRQGFTYAGPPVRRRKGCPVGRDDARWIRHRRRKAARAARRRNRSR